MIIEYEILVQLELLFSIENFVNVTLSDVWSCYWSYKSLIILLWKPTKMKLRSSPLAHYVCSQRQNGMGNYLAIPQPSSFQLPLQLIFNEMQNFKIFFKGKLQ